MFVYELNGCGFKSRCCHLDNDTVTFPYISRIFSEQTLYGTPLCNCFKKQADENINLFCQLQSTSLNVNFHTQVSHIFFIMKDSVITPSNDGWFRFWKFCFDHYFCQFIKINKIKYNHLLKSG